MYFSGVPSTPGPNETSKTAPRRPKRFPDDLTNTPKASKTAQEEYQGSQDTPKCLHTDQYGSQTPKRAKTIQDSL